MDATFRIATACRQSGALVTIDRPPDERILPTFCALLSAEILRWEVTYSVIPSGARSARGPSLIEVSASPWYSQSMRP